jgi:hypothetical protein
MKVIREFQQNFIGISGSANWTFAFTKIYKQNPKHKLMIEVASLATNDSTFDPNPNLFYIRGITQVAASCSNSYNLGAGTDLIQNTYNYLPPNDFFIGGLGGGLNALGTARGDVWIVSSPRMFVTDLQLEPFYVYYRKPNSIVVEVGDAIDGVFFSFKITEFSEEDD